MTKHEKKIILEAVSEIMKEDGRFCWAIDALLHLVGGCYPMAHVKVKRATLGELIPAPAGKGEGG